MTKTEDCSAPDCVNKYIEKGASGSVCVNCQEVLKKFMKFASKCPSEAEEQGRSSITTETAYRLGCYFQNSQ